jgi:hypothetical protein
MTADLSKDNIPGGKFFLDEEADFRAVKLRLPS